MIAVWFSCGAASAVALKLTVDKYGADEVRAVNQPIAEEDPDNQRFADAVSEWVGIPVERFTSSKYPDASADTVWRKKRAMSFPHGAPCTVALKKEARYEWERNNNPDWHVLGFTVDEKHRHERFIQTERENVIPVLLDAGLTKADCGLILQGAGIELPRIYSMGYPNANCVGCPKASSPTYWNLVRQTHPDVFDARAELSRELGARLVRVNGERIFLDELDPQTKGRPLETMPECGLFCEEFSERELE